MFFTFQFALGIVLLFNISIDVVYPSISTPPSYLTPLQVKGGVISLDQTKVTWLPNYPDSWVKAFALSTFGVTMGHTLLPTIPTADVTSLGVFAPPDCPMGAEYCLQLYLTQAPPYSQDVPGVYLKPSTSQQLPEKPPLLKLLQTPIYHLYLNKNAGTYNFPLENCRHYGYPTNGLVLCAMEYQTEDYRTSLAVGKISVECPTC